MLKSRKMYSVIFCAVAACAARSFADSVANIEAGDDNGPGNATIGDATTPVITAIGSAAGTTGDGYTYTNWAILANDGTGSIDLFGHFPTGDTYSPAVGDEVTATGTYSPFDDIPEIGTLTAISPFGSTASPGTQVVTLSQLQAANGFGASSFGILGYYIELDNITITQENATNTVPGNFPTHANGTYTLLDSNGLNPTTMFQYASSYSSAGALGGTAVPTGPVDLTGTVDIFDGAAEVIPFSITAVPEPASISLLVLGGAALMARRRRTRTA